jgi:hypothetical protein
MRHAFGFAWFITEILRNSATFRDIVVAALALQVLALVLPIFIQITIDKVLVHQAYTTLYVLAAPGICLGAHRCPNIDPDVRAPAISLDRFLRARLSRRHYEAHAAGRENPRIPHRAAPPDAT